MIVWLDPRYLLIEIPAYVAQHPTLRVAWKAIAAESTGSCQSRLSPAAVAHPSYQTTYPVDDPRASKPKASPEQGLSYHEHFSFSHRLAYSPNMEVLLGITGKDFTLIAASKATMRGPTIIKAADDKTRQLNKSTLIAFSGEAGDTIQFSEYIQANAQLYSMRNESELSPTALAHYVRGELASSLRSRKPYNVNLLLGGVDPITHKPKLFWLDYLASLAPVPYAAHGYAQYYCLSILDKHHHPDISLGEGIKLLEKCTDELKRRMPIDFKGMTVKAITKNGIVDIEFNDDKIVKSA
ncbi:proteasome component C11 [Apiospora arundinis]|uniref:Proteasome subunit beta n=1 Tax=Apiospora arundinis TaxID=335852 RepID=A0ABR2I4F9_9PEZI